MKLYKRLTHIEKWISIIIEKNLLLLTISLVAFNLIIGSLPVLNGDIHFSSDIARDFLLYEEIDHKKIILIGPRASGIQGLFHGPLWLYLNYPAYALGNGNPVYVGYYWIALTILFLVGSYFVAKKLFSKTVASYYTILLSALMIFYMHGLFNPFGAMFTMPFFIYTFYKYIETQQKKYLLLNIMILGSMIQFQMAVGIPFAILTFIYVFYISIKNKNKWHISIFFLLVLPLLTFILFDLRHDFIQVRSIIAAFNAQTQGNYASISDRINNRWDNMTQALYFAQGNYGNIINGTISLILIFFVYNKFKQYIIKPRDNTIKKLLIILYFYVGFYLLSLLFSGILLYYYTLPLIPLIFLIFCIYSMYINKRIYLILFLSVILYNTTTGISYINSVLHSKGKIQTSWVFQFDIAKKIFNSSDNNIGYFIYTPDYHGYNPKYAFSYTNKINPDKDVSLFEKKPVTYLVVEPPPTDRPDIDPNYWKKEKMKIKSKPTNTFTYPNGFTIERYELTDNEIRTPTDASVNDWLHFR